MSFRGFGIQPRFLSLFTLAWFCLFAAFLWLVISAVDSWDSLYTSKSLLASNTVIPEGKKKRKKTHQKEQHFIRGTLPWLARMLSEISCCLWISAPSRNLSYSWYESWINVFLKQCPFHLTIFVKIFRLRVKFPLLWYPDRPWSLHSAKKSVEIKDKHYNCKHSERVSTTCMYWYLLLFSFRTSHFGLNIKTNYI